MGDFKFSQRHRHSRPSNKFCHAVTRSRIQSHDCVFNILSTGIKSTISHGKTNKAIADKSTGKCTRDSVKSIEHKPVGFQKTIPIERE